MPSKTKRIDPPAAKIPVQMTRLQRESLVECTDLKAAVKRKLRQADDDARVIEFTGKELRHISDELWGAADCLPSPHRQRVVAVQKRVDDLIDDLDDEASGVAELRNRRRPDTSADLLFQFKITLLEFRPAVWRRIQVRDGTLGDLHEHIQRAFGWWNYHMHQFTIEGENYGPLPPGDFGDLDFGPEVIDEESVRLSRLLPPSAKKRIRWLYEYDFGDGWRHEILFEGYPKPDKRRKYPLCIDGARACPPEDCGGPWGYANYLEALADPRHEEHEFLLEWRGPFDPDAFNPKKATDEMRR